MSLANGRHSWAADEPIADGGTDTGPSPTELLEASLAACTAATLRMYADRKQWPLATAKVTVHAELQAGVTHLYRTLTFGGELTHEQRERLLQIARQCPVSKMLTGEIRIESDLQA
jgi:putative redox protein